jgi:hypothetical protein
MGTVSCLCFGEHCLRFRTGADRGLRSQAAVLCLDSAELGLRACVVNFVVSWCVVAGPKSKHAPPGPAVSCCEVSLVASSQLSQQLSAGAGRQQPGSLPPGTHTHTTAAATWFWVPCANSPPGGGVHGQKHTRRLVDLPCALNAHAQLLLYTSPLAPLRFCMPLLTALCCHTHPGPVFSLCLSCHPKRQQTRTSPGRSTACWSNSKSECVCGHLFLRALDRLSVGVGALCAGHSGMACVVAMTACVLPLTATH